MHQYITIILLVPIFRKYLFEVEHGHLRDIEEVNPSGPITSDIVCHSDSKALFTLKGHYGALMTIPENQLLLWPGYSGSDLVNTALLPEHDMV